MHLRETRRHTLHQPLPDPAEAAATSTGKVRILDARPMGTSWVLGRLWERLGIARAVMAAVEAMSQRTPIPGEGEAKMGRPNISSAERRQSFVRYKQSYPG